MTQKVVVIYSGGMDSFTVLNKALQQGHEVYALSFDYGQRHVKELKVAAQVCEKLGVSHKIVDISAINQLIGGSSLTDDIEVPEGHYEEESMKSTIVPNRNMILLSLAIYPDCRPEFVQKMDDVCRIANYDAVEIFSPYLNNTKIDILTDGLKMGLDYSQTWTCYNGRDKACGKCGACQERLEAFALNKVTDPLEYE